MTKEVWKNIEGYEKLYQISNFGRVKSLNYNRTGKEKILKPSKDKDGYLHVGLCKNGKAKFFRVHRLVCSAFLENPENLPQVNHKDENKENNHVDNLEWVSPKENINYGTRNEKMSKPIIQYTKEGVFIREWVSTITASKQLKIHHISECCKGKRKTCGGFLWKYKSI